MGGKHERWAPLDRCDRLSWKGARGRMWAAVRSCPLPPLVILPEWGCLLSGLLMGAGCQQAASQC